MCINMENVYDLHQHTHCFVMYITRKEIVTHIHNTTKRCPVTLRPDVISLDASISYNKRRTDITGFAWDCKEKDRSNIVIDNFQDGLYKLFKKDKKTWNKEDKFFMKAVSDYLPLAVKKTIEKNELKIENFDLFHYVFVVPSEWEEEVRDKIIRPIFVQSGLISNQEHQDRLLFYTDIESFCYYKHSFERGQNTILCRITPNEKETIIKFDLIQTATTLFNIPNAKLFPKVMKSSSVSVPKGDIDRRIKEFLRANLFPVVTTDYSSPRKSLKRKLALFNQDKVIEPILKEIHSGGFPSLEEEGKIRKNQPWISFNEEWMLSESQKEFINSLCPSIICAEIGTFLLGYMTDIVSNNFTKSYSFLWVRDHSDRLATWENDITWVEYILEHNSRSLNYATDSVEVINANDIMKGAGEAVFEAIQHSDIYCNPRIVPSEDLSFSSSVFLNSKPDAIINLDISLGATLFTCSILDEDGLIQQIYDHDHFTGDRHLPPLGYFYTFSDRTTLNVKERFIPFAERFLLGNLSDLIDDDDVSIKKDLLLELKSIVTRIHSEGEVSVSINQQKYIKVFVLMYIIYIKEEILYTFFDKFIPDQLDMKIGYAVSIESMLLNNTMESKDNLRDIIYSSGLVPKDDHSKKIRITTQGERILPAIQKPLELELTLKSYFVLCQLHEDYVQLSLHQVVTVHRSEEKGQESIIVQDEIIPIQNIYDSLCSNMWHSLLQDSRLFEPCEKHNTSDSNKTLNLFSPKVKTAFFANLKGHISDNVLQNNSVSKITDTVNLTSSCNCKVRLTTSDIIDISFMPVLQDIAYTLSASLLNKGLFGNYINIDYLFSFIRFNHNPQLQRTFATILEEEANDFNLEMGIDTSCLVVPELFSGLLQPVITQQPLCYEDFKMGALQQVCSENYAFSLNVGPDEDTPFIYKSKITDTKTIECRYEIAFPFLNKGEVVNNAQSNRKFYLQNINGDDYFYKFEIDIYRFETMDYLENNETLPCDGNIHEHVGHSRILFSDYYALRDVDIPVMFSVKYVSYTSSFEFFVKIIGPDTEGDEYLAGVTEAGIPLTLTRL